MNREERHTALAAYLPGVLNVAGPVHISGGQRLAMGQSRAMYVFDLAYDGEQGPVQRKVVTRIEQFGHLGTDSSNEVGIMRALYAEGYPVANVLAYEESNDVLGQPFFIMDYVPGVSTFSETTVDEYIASMHRLHSIDTTTGKFDFLVRPDAPREAALQQVERWYETYRTHIVGEPSPLLEEATQWLRNRAPENGKITLVHGDPGPGNYLHDEDRVTAVVDWEFIHLGDPYDDWAYLIWMRGAPYLSEAEWIERIQKIAEYELDLERLHYWKAVNFLMGVCIDQTSHRIYVDQQNPAPNLLAIATGVHLGALKMLCNTIFY